MESSASSGINRDVDLTLWETSMTETKLDVERFSLFDPLADYTLEDAKQFMMKYQVNGVFLLTKGKEQNQYVLSIYKNEMIVDYTIERDFENAEFLLKAEQMIITPSVNSIISVKGGVIPFSFLYTMERERMFVPDFQNTQLLDKAKVEIQTAYSFLAQYNISPNTFVFFPDVTKKLNIFYLYQRQDNSSWDFKSCVMQDSDFDNDFNLVIQNNNSSFQVLYALKFGDLYKLSTPTVIAPSLDHFNNWLFTKACPIPVFFEYCQKLLQLQQQQLLNASVTNS